MKAKQKVMIAAIAIAAIWTGCKKDDDLVPVPPPVESEHGVITTMTITFTDSANASNVKYATFRDPDAGGSQNPEVWDTIKLEPNKTWNVSILLLNELASPVDTVSDDVLEQGTDHLFCFTPSGSSATVTITDKDANNRPIGLQSKWETADAGTGTMQVILKHQPGVKDGTCSPGETDIDVVFQTKIQ